jgi:ubiquinone/menaquinone biosynthesis C-methylase UbiE
MDTSVINNDFNTHYVTLREQEGRLVSDEELLLLPEVAAPHPYAKEWKIRAHSCRLLKTYLEKKNRPISMLETGCGNGWLSHRLSYIHGSEILGLDINRHELAQAKRVFSRRTNIKFCLGSLEDLLPSFRFDVIVFAASIQYFPDFELTISLCLDLLKEGGEIHIIDSHFYGHEELASAKQRSRDYFLLQHQPLMEQFYFHHSFSVLRKFNHRVMYDPASLINKIKDQSPFYWIRIDKKCN